MNPVPEQYLEKRFSPIWWKLLCIAWAAVGVVFIVLETFSGPLPGDLYFIGFWLAAAIPVGIATYYLKIHARKSAWEKAHPPTRRFPWYTRFIIGGIYIAGLLLLLILTNTLYPESEALSTFARIYCGPVFLAIMIVELLIWRNSRERVPKNKA